MPWAILALGLGLAFVVFRVLRNASRRRDEAERAARIAHDDLESARQAAERRSREDTRAATSRRSSRAAAYVRHGSPRRPGHGGRPVGTLDAGHDREDQPRGHPLRVRRSRPSRVPFGCVSPKAQIGWSPFGAEIVTRIREPAR